MNNGIGIMKPTLNLTMRRKWFDMVARGIKTEEYRDCENRQVQRAYLWASNNRDWSESRPVAVFRNGYRMDSRALVVKIVGFDLRGREEVKHPEWGEPKGVAIANGFDHYEAGGVKTLNRGVAGTVINGTCPGCRSAVCFENHQSDARVRDSETSSTLGATHNAQAANNNPLVVESHGLSFDGGFGFPVESESISGTLHNNTCPGHCNGIILTNSNGDAIAPCVDARHTGRDVNAQDDKRGGYVLERRGIGDEVEVAPCLSAISCDAFGINANGVTKTAAIPFREECSDTLTTQHQSGAVLPNVASMRYVVRRLTPTECERLMGLPDGWTLPAFAPGEITDALVEEFRQIHDTFGAVMAGYAGKPPLKPKTAAWVRKWLERIADPATCPDAPRYKGCGNGWATNQPRWILLRVLVKEGIDPWDGTEG